MPCCNPISGGGGQKKRKKSQDTHDIEILAMEAQYNSS
jgi:hypothetical protein